MKPFKSGTIVAAWLLRMTLLWFVYEHYYKGFPGFDLKSLFLLYSCGLSDIRHYAHSGRLYAKTIGDCSVRSFHFYPSHCSAHSCLSKRSDAGGFVVSAAPVSGFLFFYGRKWQLIFCDKKILLPPYEVANCINLFLWHILCTFIG